MHTKTNNKNTIIFVEPLNFNITLPEDFLEKYDYHKILLVNLNQKHEFKKELYDE